MASTNINWSQITPDNGAIRELSQLILQAVVSPEKLGAFLNVIPAQRNGDKLAFVGEFGLVGKAAQGCKPTYDSETIAASEKEWSIKAWEVALEMCYEDVAGTVAQWALKNKTSIADMTGTAYLADIIRPRLELAIMKAILRLAWFGDTNAKATASGGVLLNGDNAKYFNITDGLFKRIYQVIATDSARRTTIDANAQTTKAAQKTAFMASGYAMKILDNLIMDAHPLLRGSENQVIYITQSFKDALNIDIRNNNKGSELQWNSIFMGVQESTYSGIKLISIPTWDEIIQAYEGTETKFNQPYRAIYTTTQNMCVGLESENELVDLQVWFDKTLQTNFLLAKDKLGTLIADDRLIQAAY
jgi:hypothetical protein